MKSGKKMKKIEKYEIGYKKTDHVGITENKISLSCQRCDLGVGTIQDTGSSHLATPNKKYCSCLGQKWSKIVTF